MAGWRAEPTPGMSGSGVTPITVRSTSALLRPLVRPSGSPATASPATFTPSTRICSLRTVDSTCGLWVVTINCTAGNARRSEAGTCCCYAGRRCMPTSSIITIPGLSNAAWAPKCESGIAVWAGAVLHGRLITTFSQA